MYVYHRSTWIMKHYIGQWTRIHCLLLNLSFPGHIRMSTVRACGSLPRLSRWSRLWLLQCCPSLDFHSVNNIHIVWKEGESCFLHRRNCFIPLEKNTEIQVKTVTCLKLSDILILLRSTMVCLDTEHTSLSQAHPALSRQGHCDSHLTPSNPRSPDTADPLSPST